MDNAADALLLDVHDEVSLGRSLIGVVDTGEALDLAATSLGVDTALVVALAVLEGSSDVNEEERSDLRDGLTGGLARVLVGSNGRGNDGGTGLGELGGDESNALDVLVAVLPGEAQLGGELGADGVTEQERHGAATLLVEGHLQGTGNGVLAGGVVTGQEDSETLVGAGRVGLAEDLDDLGVREPLGDVATGTQASPQLSTGDIEGLDALGDLIDGSVLVGVGQVGDLLELDDLNAQLVAVLLNRVLGVVRAVELLTLGVLTGTGVVTANNEVSGTVVLPDNGVPDGLTGTSHTHGQGQEGERGHSIGVAGEQRLVDADTGEVVDITRLRQTDDGVDQDVGLAGTSSTDGQLTVSAVHGVTARVS